MSSYSHEREVTRALNYNPPAVKAMMEPAAPLPKTSKGYIAGVAEEYFYPMAGDPTPPLGDKVNLLTIGGIATQGPWTGDGRYLGWAPLHKRNKEKEKKVAEVMHNRYK